MKKFLSLIMLVFLLAATEGMSGQRKVLVEIFTSTTCPPCAVQNPPFDNWLANYEYADLVTVVKYHVWWPSPGNDPYYLANTSEPQARVSYYGVTGVPDGIVDSYNNGSSFSTWTTAIQGRLLVLSPIDIIVTGNISTSGGTVDIKLKSDGSTMPSGPFKLHTIIVEKDLNYTGPNGDPHHEYVMRKMNPNAAGEQFTLAQGDSVSFTKTISVNAGWNFNNCELVVFVQKDATKEILQSSKTPLSDLLGVGVAENTMQPQTFALYQNTPNPFNPATAISFSLAARSTVSLRIYNMLGQEVASVLNNYDMASGLQHINFRADNLNSGVYLYKLTAIPQSGTERIFTETRKMILLK
jgi:thiol-disulfide isomerase/thioredoxin